MLDYQRQTAVSEPVFDIISTSFFVVRRFDGRIVVFIDDSLKLARLASPETQCLGEQQIERELDIAGSEIGKTSPFIHSCTNLFTD